MSLPSVENIKFPSGVTGAKDWFVAQPLVQGDFTYIFYGAGNSLSATTRIGDIEYGGVTYIVRRSDEEAGATVLAGTTITVR